MCRPTKRPKSVALVTTSLAPIVVEPVEYNNTGLETFVFDLKNDADFLGISDAWADEVPLATEDLSELPLTLPLTLEDESNRPKTFVYTAFEMVSDLKNTAAIGFSEDGSIIEIRNLEFLSEKILPAYFRHKNVTSFYRQLNSYGFRTTRSSGTNVVHAFVHELFRVGREDLLSNIFRKKCMKKQARLAAKKEEDANCMAKEERAHGFPPSPMSVSSGGSDDQVHSSNQEPIAEKKKHAREAPTQIDALREAAVRAAQLIADLEAKNSKLQNENRSILNESEDIFASVNQMADVQTTLIARLFGRDAGLAFAEQSRPFRMGGEVEAKALPRTVQEQARDYENFNEQTTEMLFEDDDLEMLESIFTAENSALVM